MLFALLWPSRAADVRCPLMAISSHPNDGLITAAFHPKAAVLASMSALHRKADVISRYS